MPFAIEAIGPLGHQTKLFTKELWVLHVWNLEWPEGWRLLLPKITLTIYRRDVAWDMMRHSIKSMVSMYMTLFQISILSGQLKVCCWFITVNFKKDKHFKFNLKFWKTFQNVIEFQLSNLKTFKYSQFMRFCKCYNWTQHWILNKD